MAEIVLTPEQQAATVRRGGALLVSAAAGSGKTRILIERLMRYVCDETQPVDVDAFLIITYTKAAAAELRSRLSAELSARLAENPGNRRLQRQLVRLHAAQISTVHAFCAAILKENAHRLDLPADFRVMEEQQARELREQVLSDVLERAYENLAEHPEREELFDTLGAGRDDRALADILKRLDGQVGCHRDPEAWMQKSVQTLQIDPTVDASETPWGAYLIQCLHETLDGAIARMKAACDEMYGIPELENAYLPVFANYYQALCSLRKCNRWDEIVQRRQLPQERLKAVRGFDDKDLLERLKAMRTQSVDEVEKALIGFTDPSSVVLAEQLRTAVQLEALFDLLRDYRAAYRAEKRRLRVMDFSDLEHEALALLTDKNGLPTAVARQLSERYCEIMVDEYQDTNAVQDAIFAAVSRNGSNCFFVGDVKQSIYRFRLADPTIFLEKYRRFPRYDPQGPVKPEEKILLSKNFRSRPEILAAVNDVFCGIMSERAGEMEYGPEEMLQAGRACEPLQEPNVELHCIATARGDESRSKAEVEAQFVAGRIAEMLTGGTQIEDAGTNRALKPEDIVILMRSPRSSAAIYLAALLQRGIPCAFEQTGNLLDTMEVQLLRSFLQVMDNPRQDIPLCAVLLSPLAGFSADEVARMRAGKRDVTLYEALCAETEDVKACDFRGKLTRLRALRPLLPLNDLLAEIIREMQLEFVLQAMPDGENRCRNIQAFLQFAASSGAGSLSELLTTLDAMEKENEGISIAAPTSTGAVRIMSVHGSKGLEFPVVFLADLSHAFNQDDLRAQVLTHPQWGAACVYVDHEKQIRYPTIAKIALAKVHERETKAEEMRVLYVAMTRARERLIMTFCGSSTNGVLSRVERDAAYPVPPEQVLGVSSPGEWVLQTAITRVEAGALRTGNSVPLRDAGTAWLVQYHMAGEQTAAQLMPEVLPEYTASSWPDMKSVERSVTFSYPFAQSTRIPAKLTATQLKGRQVDEEIAEGAAPQAPEIRFPVPDFETTGSLTAAECGTAMHLFMQFCDYATCREPGGIARERQRLLEEEFLTKEQADSLNITPLEHFFFSELGERFCTSGNLVREFKFSILAPANQFYDGAGKDEVLLQGVVDCFLNEPEGLTILDFKTDRVRPGEEAMRADYYRGQLTAYARALEQIYEKPVLKRLVYFFATDRAEQV